MRGAVVGRSSLPVEVLTEFDDRLDVPVLEGFGMSEASRVATFSYRDRPRKQGSVGLPLWVSKSEVVREDDTEAVVDECGG